MWVFNSSTVRPCLSDVIRFLTFCWIKEVAGLTNHGLEAGSRTHDAHVHQNEAFLKSMYMNRTAILNCIEPVCVRAREREREREIHVDRERESYEKYKVSNKGYFTLNISCRFVLLVRSEASHFCFSFNTSLTVDLPMVMECVRPTSAAITSCEAFG